jgi:hypothetical protein
LCLAAAAAAAAAAAGDEVISINDQPTEGWTGDMAAKLLRGQGGTEVGALLVQHVYSMPNALAMSIAHDFKYS